MFFAQPGETLTYAREQAEVMPVPVDVVALYGNETPELVDYLITTAKAAGVDPIEVRSIIQCESMWHNVQSHYHKNGVREESYGIGQIHLPSHPHVSLEEAYDERYAIRFIVENVSEGSYIWYGYDHRTKRCTNKVPLPNYAI